jgi:hypothetical protein
VCASADVSWTGRNDGGVEVKPCIYVNERPLETIFLMQLIILIHQRALLPSQFQTSLNQNCLKLPTVYQDFLTTSFLYLVVTLDFLQNPSSSIGLEIRPKSTFTAFKGTQE